MVELHKKLERQCWMSFAFIYISGFLLFYVLRVLNIKFALSLILILLFECIICLSIYILFYRKFLKVCNKRTEVMLNACEAKPYIEELNSFLKQVPHLSNQTKQQIQLLIANAYRYYGDYEKAFTLYNTLLIQNITQLQKFQIQIYITSMYIYQNDIENAQSSLQKIMLSSKKERFFQLQGMQGLALDVKVMEAYLKYRTNHMSSTELLPILQIAREEYTSMKLYKYIRIIEIVKQEGKEDIVKLYQDKLANITGDFLILQKDKPLLEGKLHECI